MPLGLYAAILYYVIMYTNMGHLTKQIQLNVQTNQREIIRNCCVFCCCNELFLVDFHLDCSGVQWRYISCSSGNSHLHPRHQPSVVDWANQVAHHPASPPLNELLPSILLISRQPTFFIFVRDKICIAFGNFNTAESSCSLLTRETR